MNTRREVEQVEAETIRALHAEGRSGREIARRVGRSRSTVQRILRAGPTWKPYVSPREAVRVQLARAGQISGTATQRKSASEAET
jgi:IS30 family transposase